MSSTPLSVGAPIEARCTKCRKNTSHLVLVIEDDKPLKVQCDSCSRQHKYRPPSQAKPKAGRRVADPQVAERQEWQELRSDMDAGKAADYSMTSAFKVGSLVRHPQFGLGLVQRQGGAHKIEVLFEDGKKVMRCK